jgi:SAM-dependent methyltransferase
VTARRCEGLQVGLDPRAAARVGRCDRQRAWNGRTSLPSPVLTGAGSTGVISAARSHGTPVGQSYHRAMRRQARYDGHADYYDENLGPFTTAASEVIRELLGAGSGRCLDLGCGTGIHLPLLHELGWSVTGLDASADMLRRAEARAPAGVDLVQGDLVSVPFAAGSFEAVAAIFVHTDADDYPAAVREAARVLRPGGRFVHVGLHPCFVGPFSRYQGPDEPPLLFHGYRETDWTNDAPGFGEGLRRIVGSRHLPLADLLNAHLAAGFRLERFAEPPGHEFPRVLAVTATRS